MSEPVIPKVIDPKAQWEAIVRSSVRMLPGYYLLSPGDPRLFAPNKKIDNPQDFRIKQIAETLVGHHLIQGGLGLAAPQIGINLKMFAMSMLDQNGKPTNNTAVLMNARVIDTTTYTEDQLSWGQEGCLSLPGQYYEVCRLNSVVVIASTYQQPKPHKYVFHGMQARIVQHEIRHTQGVLINMEGNCVRPLSKPAKDSNEVTD